MVDSGKVKQGQLFDRQTGAIVPFSEQIENYAYGGQSAHLGDAATEIIPHDANCSQNRVFDPTAIATALASVHFSLATLIALDLPNELVAIGVTFNTSQGEGSDGQAGDVAAIGTSVSGSLSLAARATSSVSIIPEVQVFVKEWREWAKRTPMVEYYFYMPGDVSYAQIKARCEALAGDTINDWPKFRPERCTIIASGKQLSLTANSAIHQSVSVGPSEAALMWTTGGGSSYESGNSVKTYITEPLIHGEVTISGNSTSATIDASTAVSWPDQTNWPARSAGATITSPSVDAYVLPVTFSAQAVPTVPTSGLYLYHYEPRLDKDGHSQVVCQVVDMSYFA